MYARHALCEKNILMMCVTYKENSILFTGVSCGHICSQLPESLFFLARDTCSYRPHTVIDTLFLYVFVFHSMCNIFFSPFLPPYKCLDHCAVDMREVTVSARARARGQGQEPTMRVKTVAFFFKTGYPGGMFKNI